MSYSFELANTSAGNSQFQTQFQLAESARWGYRNLNPHPIPNQFRSSTQPRDLTTCFSTSIKQVDREIPTSHPAALIIMCQEKPQPPPPFCSTVDGYPLPTTASSVGPGSSASNTPDPSLGSLVLAWSLPSLLTANSETKSRLGVSAEAKFVLKRHVESRDGEEDSTVAEMRSDESEIWDGFSTADKINDIDGSVPHVLRRFRSGTKFTIQYVTGRVSFHASIHADTSRRQLCFPGQTIYDREPPSHNKQDGARYVRQDEPPDC